MYLTIASANLYSVTETTKVDGLESYTYLRKIFTTIPQAATLEQIEALLLWNVKSGVDHLLTKQPSFYPKTPHQFDQPLIE